MAIASNLGSRGLFQILCTARISGVRDLCNRSLEFEKDSTKCEWYHDCIRSVNDEEESVRNCQHLSYAGSDYGKAGQVCECIHTHR